MALSILHVALIILNIELSIEKPPYSYRFDVYPVDKCPMNSSEFKTAAKRRNCTEGTRYLCAPDKYLENLIEFCTDVKRSLFVKGNCVRLEGEGGLNHYRCVDTFVSGCPNSSYTDDNIYKYPACLEINKVLKCFVAEESCLERISPIIPSTTERYLYNSTRKSYGNKNTNTGPGVAIVISVLVLLLSVLSAILLIYFYRKRKKKKEVQIDEKKLREFLSEGQLTSRQVRCIIVGCAGAGKTTLLKRLQNVSYKDLQKTKRTEIAEVHVNSFEVLEDEGTIKGVKKKDELPSIIFSMDMFKTRKTLISEKEYIKESDLSEDELSEVKKEGKRRIMQIESSNTTDDLDSEENYEAEGQLHKHSEDTSDSERIVTQQFLTEEERVDIENEGSIDSDGIHNIGENVNLLNELKTKPETVVHTSDIQHDQECDDIATKTNYVDDEKHAIIQIMNAVKKLSNSKHLNPRITFLDFGGQCMYYAFHQIYLSPKTCYIMVVDMTKSPYEKVTVRHSDEKSCSQFESWTYRDYYKFWLTSIDSYSDINTPVLVVGTHAEKMSDEDCRKFFREFFALFDEHSNLRRHLREDRKFAIKFPESGSKLEDLIKIKSSIACVVQDPMYSVDHVRPVWAIFEQILQRKKNRRIISRKELTNYNKKLSKNFQMNEDEMTQMLLFMHRVGNLLYFNGCTKGTIILDIQWFVNAFICLIEFNSKTSATECQRSRFQNTGELNEQELHAIWKNENEKEKDYYSYKTEIISCMEHLGLLAMYESEKYYIPSMNKNKFENNPNAHIASSILCFQFDEKRKSPLDLLHGVILKCLKIPGWYFLKERDKNCLYRNAACFSVKEFIVVVCLCKFQIQVQVWRPGKEGSIAKEFLDEIQRSIEEKINEYKIYSYEKGYKCRNAVLNDEDDMWFNALHIFPVRKNMLICQRCKLKAKHYLDNTICWATRQQDVQDTHLNFKPYDEENDEGYTSLKRIIQACEEGNFENFSYHLEKEIGPRKNLLFRIDKDGWNVLHFAAKGGNLDIFRRLTPEKELFNKTHEQMNVLHIASKFGQYKICEYILGNEYFRHILHEKTVQGKNACHYAAEGGHVKVFQLLARKGIEAITKTEYGQNVFHIACIHNKLDMCYFISENYYHLMFEECAGKWNALLFAAKIGNTSILEFLQTKNFDFCHTSESYRNALHIACDHGHLNACKTILETCPSLLDTVDHKGRHAGHFAVRGGNVEVLRYLFTQGANLRKETNTGMNILHMACLHSYSKMCEYILCEYPEMNSKKTARGWTTMHFVAEKGNSKGSEIKIFEMLSDATYKVDCCALTDNHNSVLTLAVRTNDYKLVEYLLKVHKDISNIQGANPLRVENTNTEMIQILEKNLG